MSVIFYTEEQDSNGLKMKENYAECIELVGKTIRALRVYKDTGDGTEVQIDLTDGTGFSCSVRHSPLVRALVYKSSAGTPAIIREYDL